MIRLMITAFLLLYVFKIHLSTASDLVAEIESTVSTDYDAFSMQTSLTDCQNLTTFQSTQKCTFNDLFIELVELKGKGSFGQVWKVTYSRSIFGVLSADRRFAAIKFVQCSAKFNSYIAANEIDILMRMYQDRVEHVTEIIPDLTTDMSVINLVTNEIDPIEFIVIGMQYYEIDVYSYHVKNARTSNFDIHLLVANLMVCTVLYINLFFRCEFIFNF